MTSTDRAFIAAIQQASAGVTTAAGSPSMEFAAPHFSAAASPTDSSAKKATGSSRAPLSEHLARRREAAERQTTAKSTTDRTSPLRPGVEVDSLRWPDVVQRLQTEARTELLALLSESTQAGKSAEAPAIVFVSARAGVGGTTALLATASLIASVGGKVAILDLSGSDGAAAHLGVRRVAHLDGRLDASAIDDLLVTSRDRGTSVLAADQERLAQAALARLTATHDLVLIDAGVAGSTSEMLANASMAEAPVLLIDAADASTRHAALDTLARHGVSVTGLVETLIDDA